MKKVFILMSSLYVFPISSPAINLGDLLGERFKPYKMNYAMWQKTPGDQDSIEVQYSFKYMVYRCNWGANSGIEIDQKICGNGILQDLQFFASYTGEFDFYLNTRPSGPVVNRTSNPALHIRAELPKITFFNYWVDLGIEHRSNGQVTNANDTDRRGNYITQRHYLTNNHQFFDGISRGSNYWILSTGINFGNKHNEYGRYDTEIGLSYKFLYLSDESNITWGPLAGTGANIKDYDRLTLSLSQVINALKTGVTPEVRLGLEYTLGDGGFGTDSLDISAFIPLNLGNGSWVLPLFAKAHFGPMERLSDYTRSVPSYGMGFAFSY